MAREGFPLIVQGSFVDRANFGEFLNNKGLLGSAVEIGTHRGLFAYELLTQWAGKVLHCIDPWSIPIGYEDQAETLKTISGSIDRADDMKAAAEILPSHSTRVKFWKETSAEALEHFENRSIDFVYIDGDHRQEKVREDLIGWWMKLAFGGVIAGHDIICPGEIEGGWGREVQPAVCQFALEVDRPIHLVIESNNLPWSFYIIK